MQLTLLTLGLCASTLATAIPVGINRAGGAAAVPAAAAPATGFSSDGHQITNPAFDGAANFDLDMLNAQGQGMKTGNAAAAAGPKALAAAPATATAALDDDASLAAEVSSIEKLFGKRDGEGEGEGEEMDVSEVDEEGEGEGENDLEKRDPATLTAYLIYCLKHPKQCRAVKVH